MISGVDLSRTEEFISTLDQGEVKTLWRLAALDTVLLSAAMAGEGRTTESMLALTRFGLKGFEHFQDAEGKEIRWETQSVVMGSKTYHVVADKILKQIPLPVVVEMGTRILSLSVLQKDEIKN